MKYIALLRGVNVGGNSIVKMSDLKDLLVAEGFTNVSTYINSGNVIFESAEHDKTKLLKKIDTLLLEKFSLKKTVVLTATQLHHIADQIPLTWKDEDIRKYIAFVREPFTPEDVIKEAELKDGIDFIEKGPGVVYMSTKMEGITKTKFTKLIATKIYKEITMRNYNTVKKLLTLVEKN